MPRDPFWILRDGCFLGGNQSVHNILQVGCHPRKSGQSWMLWRSPSLLLKACPVVAPGRLVKALFSLVNSPDFIVQDSCGRTVNSLQGMHRKGLKTAFMISAHSDSPCPLPC